jgi:inorganic pyrophosphatase
MKQQNYLTLPIGERAPQRVNAVVEVPGGNVNKYEYDKELHVFRLDRPLFSSVHYPCEYGFVPSTLNEDGDALDILVLTVAPTFSGCVLQARPVGVLRMVDQGKHDQKILAVAQRSPIHEEIRDYHDVAAHVLKEIEHFFTVYKQLEGKKTEVRGWQGRERAYKLIVASHRRFETAGRREGRNASMA